ncbi:hypothetical protein GL267_010305 [Acidithiobacillus ferrianus]|uniref:Uncharacterized protein n=2 Tax=Acidithiobacillus ferrianus TaxID=2678518 RepID=A0A845UF87_9PROT|nr:hypothetical protein [Acidithiobacillus ferrianus]NDU43250.1 hypothetical protein [Acidithiobacillus ferrianus]
MPSAYPIIGHDFSAALQQIKAIQAFAERQVVSAGTGSTMARPASTHSVTS